MIGNQAVTDLFMWHALEESEHKAVAFDVYRAVGGSERLRTFTMNLLTFGFLTGMSIQVLVSLLGDRDDVPAGQAAPQPGAGLRSRRSSPRSCGSASGTTTAPTSTPTTTTPPSWWPAGGPSCSATPAPSTTSCSPPRAAAPTRASDRPASTVDHATSSTSTSSSSAPACPASAPATASRRVPHEDLRDPRGPRRSAAPGTCSATRASGRTPTCSRSGTRSGRGPGEKSIADGASILAYIDETAKEYGIDEKIRYEHRVVDASWTPTTRGGPWMRRSATTPSRCSSLQLPVPVQRLLQLRRRLHARLPRPSTRSRARSSTPSSGPRTSTTRARRS